jgi:hypothetical protein
VSRPSADRLPEQFAVSYGISGEKFVFALRSRGIRVARHANAPREKSSSDPSRSILDREDLNLLTFDLFASSEETQT